MAGSAAASAGGAAINSQNQNAAITEQNRQNQETMKMNAQSRADENVRQRAMEDEQAASVAEALAGADPAKALLTAQQEVKAPQNPIVETADAYNSGNSAEKAPFKNATVEAAVKPGNDKREKTTSDMTEALAMLSAIGTGMAGANRGIGRSGSEIATTGSFRRGSAGVAGQEASVPSAEVTPSDQMIGDILLLGGQIGGNVGGARAGRAGWNPGDILKPKPKPIGWL
jgi:hypothetical protein